MESAILKNSDFGSSFTGPAPVAGAGLRLDLVARSAQRPLVPPEEPAFRGLVGLVAADAGEILPVPREIVRDLGHLPPDGRRAVLGVGLLVAPEAERVPRA